MTESPLIRVLLVDDESLAREMLREMLQGDLQVTIVGNLVTDMMLSKRSELTHPI